MAFKGITFAGQNVTPKNDGGLYQAHYGDGILWGCSMAISGDDLVIQSGEFIAGGRVCQVDGATNVDLSGRTLQTGYIQVIMNYDLSQGEGSQWYTTFVESATTTFPALTKDDINDTGTLYQYQLAIVQISGGNLTSITTRFPYSSISTYAMIMDDVTDTAHATLSMSQGGSSMLVVYPDTDKAGSRIATTNQLGTQTSGLYMSRSGYASLFGDGTQAIYIRPYGPFDSTNQSVFYANGGVTFPGTVTMGGQQYGGHPISTFNTAGNISCPADTTTVIQSATSLASAGVYLVSASFVFTPSASTNTQFRISLASNTDSYTYSVYTANGGASHMGAISGLFTGASTVNLRIHPYSGSVTCTANSRKIEITRLA